MARRGEDLFGGAAAGTDRERRQASFPWRVTDCAWKTSCHAREILWSGGPFYDPLGYTIQLERTGLPVHPQVHKQVAPPGAVSGVRRLSAPSVLTETALRSSAS